MKKLQIQHKLRWWLILLFSCLSSYGYAYDIKIEGYNSIGQTSGYPLFEISSAQIKISSTRGQFDYVYIDDAQVSYNNDSYWSTYTLDITNYMDGNLHKLQLKKSSSNYGICYFYHDTDLSIDGVFYSVSGETASVVGAKKDIETANILSEYEYNGEKYPVISIGEKVFDGCSGLTSVTIGNSVTSIGSSAFSGCSGLTSVTIGNSVTSIGSSAFSGCSGLTSVTIPNSVLSIGNSAFDGCTGIKEITIEDGDKTLSLGYNYYTSSSSSTGKGLFYDCPFEKLYIGRNITYNSGSSYGYSPFYGKTNLTELTISSSVTSIPANLLRGYLEVISVTLPSSVTSIGESAFLGCSGLTTITIPSSVTSIDNYAFNGCIGIKEIKFEDGDETLSLGYNGSSKGLFYDCPFEKLYIGRNITYNSDSSYGYSPFYGKTNLTELTISSSVTSIPANLLRGYSELTSLTIPNSVISIGASAFYNCSGLNSITIPNAVTEIGNYAFDGCTSIKEITIEDGDKTLSLGYNYGSSSSSSYRGLFYDCPLEKLYLGRNLTYNTGSSYGYSPFYGNTTLKNLILGQAVSEIGSNCFSNCSSLKEFRTKAYNIGGLANSGLSAEKVLAIITPEQLNEEMIELLNQSNLIYFNNLVVEAEDKTYSLVTAPNYVNINDCVVKNSTIQLIPIKNEAVAKADAKSVVNAYFRGNDIMSELCDSGFKFSPSSVWKENIFDIYANSNAGGDYRHITMKQAGSLFDELGLQDIQSLKHLKITGDINGTDIMTINRMTSLKYLDLTDANIVEGGVTYRENLKTENNVVGSDFFYNIALETVLLPESAKNIANSAFRNSPELKNVVIGKSIASIGDYAFNNCELLNRINIPANVTSINQNVFYQCI